jgi:hypothetical protein
MGSRVDHRHGIGRQIRDIERRSRWMHGHPIGWPPTAMPVIPLRASPSVSMTVFVAVSITVVVPLSGCVT